MTRMISGVCCSEGAARRSESAALSHSTQEVDEFLFPGRHVQSIDAGIRVIMRMSPRLQPIETHHVDDFVQHRKMSERDQPGRIALASRRRPANRLNVVLGPGRDQDVSFPEPFERRDGAAPQGLDQFHRNVAVRLVPVVPDPDASALSDVFREPVENERIEPHHDLVSIDELAESAIPQRGSVPDQDDFLLHLGHG
jgi:hypothetical protein